MDERMNGRIRLLKREIINKVSNTFFAEIRGGPVRSQTIHVRSLHAADFHRWRATIGDYSRTRHARCTSRCQVSSICWINCQLSAARSLRVSSFVLDGETIPFRFLDADRKHA